MGKRELVLIALFVLLGIGAWQLTAPAPTPGREGFSLARLAEHLRTAFRSERYKQEVQRSATTTPAPEVRTLLVAGIRGTVVVVGSDRPDATLELKGAVFGADLADAVSRAAQFQAGFLTHADRLVVEVREPPSRRRGPLELTVTVPRRLDVRLEAERGRADIRQVAAVELDTRRTAVTLASIAGAVTGEHREESLDATDVGSVRLKTRRAEIRLDQVRGTVGGELTEGRLLLRRASGPVQLTVKRIDAELEDVTGDIELTAADGGVKVRGVAGVLAFQGQRCALTATLLPGATKLDVRDEDAFVDITLAPGKGAVVDLEADSGDLTLPHGADLAVTSESGRHRANGTLFGGGPSIMVRTARNGVAIRQ